MCRSLTRVGLLHVTSPGNMSVSRHRPGHPFYDFTMILSESDWGRLQNPVRSKIGSQIDQAVPTRLNKN